MSRYSASKFLIVIALLLCAAMAIYGQAVSGTLTGTVFDSSGAVVPGVNIVMINESSGDIRRTVSNAEGYFAIAGVPASSFTVTVEAPGFNQWEKKGIVFNPGDKRNLSDIVLTIGATGQNVVVTADAVELTPVDSGERSAVITNKQLSNISIVSRNAAEFIKILPGMAMDNGGADRLLNKASYTGETVGINGSGTAGSQSAVGSYSANGSGRGGIDVVSDGAHVSDPGGNNATPVNPNADMTQEVKVLTSNFGAENSKGPVVVTTVAKAGGQHFHGQGYFYARHYALNANEWLLNKSAAYKDGQHIDNKPESKYYYPGGNIGGPVIIPGTNFNRNRDKMFFFTGFESYRQTVDTGSKRAFVPTAEMRNGDFSPASIDQAGTVRPWWMNSVSNANYPGGIISPSQMDPGGKALINLYPMPNVDPNGPGGGYNYISAALVDQNSWQSLTRVDYSFSDNTKLFVRYNIQKEVQLFPLGMWQIFDNSVPYPSSTQGRNQSQSVAASLTHVFSPTLTSETVVAYTYEDFPNTIQDPQKVDRAALGYPYKGIYNNNNPIVPNVNGAWGGGIGTIFNPGGFTPSLFFTKKLPSFAENITKVTGKHTVKTGLFVEDTNNNQQGDGLDQGQFVYNPGWSPTGNNYADLLTGQGWFNYLESNRQRAMNIAMRPIEFYLQDSWKVTRRLTLEGGMRFQHMRGQYDRNGHGFSIFDPQRYNNDPAALAEQTGIVWHAQDSRIPVTGSPTRAMFYSPRAGLAWDAFGNGKTVIRGGVGAFRYYDTLTSMQDALATSYGVRSTQGDPWSFGGNTFAFLDTWTPSAQVGGATVVDRLNDREPSTWSYNLTISQRLPRDTMWEIAYVGSQSSGLLGQRRLNAVPWGAMWADPNGAADANADNYRPMLNYQGITEYTHFLKSQYDSFQTSLTRQRGRVNYMINYTFSKAMGNRGGNENLQGLGETAALANTWGPMGFDRTHVFNVAYTIDLPGPRARFAKAVLGGWQVSGISQVQSGVNLQAAMDANFNADQGLNGISRALVITGSPDVGVYPRLICDPRQGLGKDQFVNGACFAQPTIGQNGDYIYPDLRGPAFVNHNLSVFKNFSFSEARTLQFRFSAFNFLNQSILSFANSNNLKLHWDANGKVDTPNYGVADVRYGHRVVQLAVKFSF